MPAAAEAVATAAAIAAAVFPTAAAVSAGAPASAQVGISAASTGVAHHAWPVTTSPAGACGTVTSATDASSPSARAMPATATPTGAWCRRGGWPSTRGGVARLRVASRLRERVHLHLHLLPPAILRLTPPVQTRRVFS